MQTKQKLPSAQMTEKLSWEIGCAKSNSASASSVKRHFVVTMILNDRRFRLAFGISSARSIIGITALAADCVRCAPVSPIFLGKRKIKIIEIANITAVRMIAKTLMNDVAEPKSVGATVVGGLVALGCKQFHQDSAVPDKISG